MLVKKDGKTYKVTKKNFRKALLNHAVGNDYDLSALGTEMGAVEADLDIISPEDAMKKVEEYI